MDYQFPEITSNSYINTQVRKLEEEVAEVVEAYTSIDAGHLIEEVWDVVQCTETLLRLLSKVFGEERVAAGKPLVETKNRERGYYEARRS